MPGLFQLWLWPLYSRQQFHLELTLLHNSILCRSTPAKNLVPSSTNFWMTLYPGSTRHLTLTTSITFPMNALTIFLYSFWPENQESPGHSKVSKLYFWHFLPVFTFQELLSSYYYEGIFMKNLLNLYNSFENNLVGSKYNP